MTPHTSSPPWHHDCFDEIDRHASDAQFRLAAQRQSIEYYRFVKEEEQ